MFCFIFLVVYGFEGGSTGYLAIATIVAGLICSARLLLSSHKPFDIYADFL